MPTSDPLRTYVIRVYVLTYLLTYLLGLLNFFRCQYVYPGKGNEVSLMWYRGFALKNRTQMVSIVFC